MKNISRKGRKGFSLITTVTILVLLSLIAVGLLSLSAVTVRSSTAELAQLEARANARLALMVAIGELQMNLGPDQRVSAEAGILDEDPDPLGAEGIQGVKHPHWVGVWTTEWVPPGSDGENKSPWVRNDEEGGLSDQRFTGAAGKTFDRERDVLSYLVSGNEGGRAELGVDLIEALAWNGEDQVELVADGTVSTTEEYVVAPRVATRDDYGRETGGYAYWIGDLGVRANVGLVDAYALDDPARGQNADGMERILNAQDTSAKELDGINDDLDHADVRKLVSRKTVELTDGPPSRENALRKKKAFHHMTTQSKSVLCNVRQGGLLRDLTAYIHSRGTIRGLQADGRTVSQGIDDLDNMIGPANASMADEQGTTWGETKYRDIAPTFALVRNWAQAARRTAYDDREATMVDPAPPSREDIAKGTLRGMNDGVNVYDGGNLRPASFLPFIQPNLFPVMTEASVYYNLATYPQNERDRNSKHTLRVCVYPRVSLWNPYNVELKLHNMVATIFVNGNKDVRLTYSDRTQSTPGDVPIPFGRGSTKINNQRGVRAGAKPSGSDNSPGHYVGWVLMKLLPTTMAPGETLVFSPMRTAEYQLYQIDRNVLSSQVAPDPSRYFWQDLVLTHDKKPISFVEFPGSGNSSGGDNYMMSLKSAGRMRSFNDSQFNSMQSIVYANTSLQAGGSDELPVQWSTARGRQPEPRVHSLANSRAALDGTAIPDTRTRDGFRLRWWDEHRSNMLGSGQLRRDPQHLKSSVIGTWNPRAAYFCRNPWDNVTDLPPHFYGVYTRDLFDQRVSWQNMMPRSVDGRQVSWPFGDPLSAPDDGVVLFEVPREETGIPSLGYLRHLKLSEFGWHPSYAVGNSLVDPRVGRQYTSPVLATSREKARNGWNQYLFGHQGGRTSGRGGDYWAMLTRQILFNRPDDHFVVYDLSYETNFNLWDNFFVSTGDPARKLAFMDNPEENPLPNGRFQLIGTGTNVKSDVVNFHRAATQLWLNGGFNVNSVSVDAWKAVLASAMNAGAGYASKDAVPFPRVINPPNGEFLNGNWDDEEATSGFLAIDGSDASDSDLERLAQEIVREVKERAPFFGLSDFINRRLVDSEHGDAGPIEAAIQRSGINEQFDENETLRIPNTERDRLADVTFDNMADATRLDQRLKPDSVAWGIPGYLTQGDVVQAVGSALRPRSDSFLVRTYGESKDANGKVLARAWCEAVVQRTPEPVNPDRTGINPVAKKDPEDLEFGRRFKLVSFRWLSPEEV